MKRVLTAVAVALALSVPAMALAEDPDVVDDPTPTTPLSAAEDPPIVDSDELATAGDVTDEEYALFSEWDVDSDPVAGISLFDESAEGTSPQARGITSIGPFRWVLEGAIDARNVVKRTNPTGDGFSGKRIVMVRNRPGSFVIGYALANAKRAARFDVRWTRGERWYGGYAYGEFDGCSWLQAKGVFDDNATTPAPGRCESAEQKNRAPEQFAALVNCDACNGPQRARGGDTEVFVEAYRNVAPWKKNAELSLPFRSAWQPSSRVGWRYITRNWKYVALADPGSPKGYNTAFVPLGDVWTLPAEWDGMGRRARQDWICEQIHPGNGSFQGIQAGHGKGIWPRVCDVVTPPGGVTKAKCQKLRGFAWKKVDGEFTCVYVRAKAASVPVDPPTPSDPAPGTDCPAIPEPWLCNAIIDCQCLIL